MRRMPARRAAATTAVGTARTHVAGGVLGAAQAHAQRGLRDAERDDDGVVTGHDAVEQVGVGGVAVDRVEARTRGERRGVAGEGGHAVAALQQRVADGAAGSAGRADHEDVHEVLRS